MVSKAERERERNIARNKALLEALGLPEISASVAPSSTKKRKATTSQSSDSKRPKKVPRPDLSIPDPGSSETTPEPTERRRSARNAGKKVEYNGEAQTNPGDSLVKSRLPRIVSEGNFIEHESNTEYVGNKLGKRLHNPKTYGHIPGIEVGTWWATRAQCSTDAVHAPFVAGISGHTEKGAYSVALSGGYDDDVDLGYAFTYTGSGGRDLKGTKNKPKNLRTAPQSSHQTFDNTFNKCLESSVKTRKPVRVIRGYKLRSPFATEEGYRYDGLYVVEKAWMELGLEGYQVCKFAFKRLPGQPPLPRREEALNDEPVEGQSADEESDENIKEEDTKDN
ncbi:hypothetical protein SISNIDRAFT_92679 [Sistotremastrum niveocremeum HHB9708]|uniref:YDG domain-containing protein n=1 Tax=Sistotremastrum niveocremeum HHB9708 TaxID=1314777 RepID=A0A164U7E4_9AGAM|nr:hypothetical protein SISNIDRAFT_92679 [Sistotremastrum niveocremeum HHB9708]